MLAGIIAAQSLTSDSKYKFEIEKPIESTYEEAIISTDEAKSTAEIIISEMAALGIEPLYEQGYTQEYKIAETCRITSYNVCYTKLLRFMAFNILPGRAPTYVLLCPLI